MDVSYFLESAFSRASVLHEQVSQELQVGLSHQAQKNMFRHVWSTAGYYLQSGAGVLNIRPGVHKWPGRGSTLVHRTLEIMEDF